MSITEVAKLAGVSSSTVSRVINNHPRVAPETVEQVQRAMKKLNYTPSDRRPGPKPTNYGRTATKTIAFFVLGANNNQGTPGFSALASGVSVAASELDVQLLLHHIPDVNQLPSKLLSQLDGVLLHGFLPGPEVREHLEKLPTVWLMANRQRPTWGDQVMPDAYEIGTMVARHLIEKGHKSICFLNMDSERWSFRMACQAFAATAQAAGVEAVSIEEPLAPAAAYWQRFRPETISNIVKRFHDLKSRPTGLFVAEDMQVAMLQPALQASGVAIGPGETEVVSCNNELPYLVGLSPLPSVVDIRLETIGHRAVEQLLWRLEHRDAPERMAVLIEPALIRADERKDLQVKGTAQS